MDLRRFLRIMRARLGLILFVLAATVGTTALVSLLLPPRYTATASIVIDFRALDPLSGTVLPAMLLPGYLATQLDIISSHNVAVKAVDLLGLAQDADARREFLERAEGKGSIRDWLAEELLKELKLEPSRESSLVNIHFRSKDPRRAAEVANAVVRAYVSTNLELKVEPARQTAAWFDEQIKGLKRDLEVAQGQLSAFQRANGIMATDERFDIESARLAELSSQVVGAQAQTFDSVSRQREVNATVARGGSPDSLADVLNNPGIQSLKAELAQQEAKLAALTGRVGVNHPAYQAALSEAEKLKRNLADEMRAVTRSVNTTSSIVQSREGALRGSLAAQRAKVLDLRKQRDEAALLMRVVDNAQRAYDSAMARFSQSRMESHSNQTNIALINPAIEPALPSSPKIALNILLSVVFGAFLAIGMALIAELTDRIVRSELDVSESLGVPVLGSIGSDPRPREFSLKRLLSGLIPPRAAGRG